MIETAARVGVFTESVIREMTRLAAEHDGINLAQGFPDFPAPAELLAAAARALEEGYNQYAITWGAPNFRRALAEKARSFNGIIADPGAQPHLAFGSAANRREPPRRRHRRVRESPRQTARH